MAAKRFGAIDLSADTDEVLMTGASGHDSTVNVRFVNRNNSNGPNGAVDVFVRLALVPFGSGNAIANLDNADYLEFEAIIPPQDVLEDTGIAVQAGHSLVVRSDTNHVNVLAYGFEEQM